VGIKNAIWRWLPRGRLLNRWWRRLLGLQRRRRRILRLRRVVGELGGRRKPAPDGCVSINFLRLASHVIRTHLSVGKKGTGLIRAVRTLVRLLRRDLRKSRSLVWSNRWGGLRGLRAPLRAWRTLDCSALVSLRVNVLRRRCRRLVLDTRTLTVPQKL
jgi:hypothetical protein